MKPDPRLTRRQLLKSGGLALAGLGIASDALARSAGAWAGVRRRTLVIVFLRGGADGLNIVVPFGDPDYAAARPTIGVASPGRRAGGIELDGFFGLHPSLAPLVPLYRQGFLGLVHACGAPRATRSHLEAQAQLEHGVFDGGSAEEGWIARCLRASPQRGVTPFRAVAAAPYPPQAFERVPAIALAGHEAALRMTRTARPPYPSSPLGNRLRQIACLVHADVGVEIAWIDSGGWDDHAGEPDLLPARLQDLARALAAFSADVYDRLDDLVVLTLSEFGRTVAENQRQGTDHGHGMAVLLIGGAIRGGRIHGMWPGLAPDRPTDGGGLAVTTDIRDILGEVIARHLGVPDPAVVFPGHRFGLCEVIRS